VNFGPLTKKL